MIRRLLAFALVSLSACGSSQEAPQSPQAIAQAATKVPADAHLAMLYQQSCKLCHAIQGSGAPLTGDRSGWDDRWKKGMPALAQSVIVGLNGMPAGGQCFACTAADYEALIRFMTARE